MEKIVGIIMTFIMGLVFIGIGKYFTEKDKKLKTKGIRTQAKVLEKKIGCSRRAYITVEYTGGEKIITKRIVTTRSLCNGYPFEAGEYTDIFYNRNKPKSFCFENDKRDTLRAIIFYCAGGMEIAVGFLSFFSGIN